MVDFATGSAVPLAESGSAENTGTERASDEVLSTLACHRSSAALAPAAELERLGDSIAELAAHLHAATYRLLVMLAEFDRRGGWGGGFRSCAHWRSGRSVAHQRQRCSRRLSTLRQPGRRPSHTHCADGHPSRAGAPGRRLPI